MERQQVLGWGALSLAYCTGACDRAAKNDNPVVLLFLAHGVGSVITNPIAGLAVGGSYWGLKRSAQHLSAVSPPMRRVALTLLGSVMATAAIKGAYRFGARSGNRITAPLSGEEAAAWSEFKDWADCPEKSGSSLRLRSIPPEKSETPHFQLACRSGLLIRVYRHEQTIVIGDIVAFQAGLKSTKSPFPWSASPSLMPLDPSFFRANHQVRAWIPIICVTKKPLQAKRSRRQAACRKGFEETAQGFPH